MMHELDFYGLLISPLLAAFVMAWLVQQVVTRLAEHAGLYRYVVSRSVFDIAVLATLTAIFTRILFFI